MIKDKCYSHIFKFLARSVVLFSITILLLCFLLSKAIYVYMIAFFMFGAKSTVFLLFVWASQQSRLLSFYIYWRKCFRQLYAYTLYNAQ